MNKVLAWGLANWQLSKLTTWHLYGRELNLIEVLTESRRIGYQGFKNLVRFKH